MNFKKEKNGMTLIEVLVTIVIIAIITSVVFVNYRNVQKQLTLRRTVNKLSQDIRRVGGLAMTAEDCQTCPGGGVPVGGYGIYFEQGRADYILYADGSGNEERGGSGDVDIETVDIEEGVYISALSSSPLSINFKPPDPEIKLAGGSVTNAIITLCLIGADCVSAPPNPNIRTVTVNNAGLIDID